MPTLVAGFLLESDIMSLSTDLKLKDTTLYDQALGASHRLHPKAVFIVKRLIKPERLSDLYAACLKESIKPERVNEFVIFLNSLGGLVIKRSLISNLASIIWQLPKLIYGMMPSLISKRYEASRRGLTLAVGRTIALLSLAVIVVSVLVFGSGASLGSAVLLSTSFISILYFSVVLHELAHLLIINNYAAVPAVVIQNGLRLGIIHRAMERRYEIICALIGPALGTLSALLSAVIVFGVLDSAIVLAIGLLISVVHLMALLPGYSDGKSLRKAWSFARSQA